MKRTEERSKKNSKRRRKLAKNRRYGQLRFILFDIDLSFIYNLMVILKYNKSGGLNK